MPSPLSIPAHPPVVGLILAGGWGRRMAEGADPHAAAPPPKPLVILDGRPLVAHVAERLRPQVSDILINANDAPDAFTALGFPVIPDTRADRPGPLAGVLAGLEYLDAIGSTAILVSAPADTPFLPADLVARLLARHRESGGVVQAGSGGRGHPVVALWPRTARAMLAEALDAGERRVGRLLQRLHAVTEEWEAADGDPFFNVNTLDDLEMAAFRLRGGPTPMTPPGHL